MSDKLDILFVSPDPRRGAGCNISLLGVIAGLDGGRFRTYMAVPNNNEYQDGTNHGFRGSDGRNHLS